MLSVITVATFVLGALALFFTPEEARNGTLKAKQTLTRAMSFIPRIVGNFLRWLAEKIDPESVS